MDEQLKSLLNNDAKRCNKRFWQRYHMRYIRGLIRMLKRSKFPSNMGETRSAVK